jgi:hypothetical protein
MTSSRRRFLRGSAAVGAAGLAGGLGLPSPAGAAPGKGPTILVNNVGYELGGPKRAVIASASPDKRLRPYQVVDTSTGAVVHSGKTTFVGPVADWLTNQFPTIPSHYSVVDFSALARPGEYTLVVDGTASYPFRVEASLYERRTLGHVAHFFKDSRSSGQFDKADRSLPAKGTTTRYDAHGGWYDAAADWGKHFTQLSSLSYFNTLSIPLTAWVLFAAHDQFDKRGNTDLAGVTAWLLDEAMYGADFLTRVHPKGQSFYSSVNQPEADDLSVDPTKRTISTRQVSYREGGGLAIAALARASTYQVSGEYAGADYLAAATDAFDYLQANNLKLVNDGKENILDDYNALLAATELAKATARPEYRQAADARAKSLVGRLASWQTYRDYWRADDNDRPYFHPSDAGLPVVSLVAYAEIADAATRTAVLDAVRRSLEFELSVTAEVTNPFGYARQLVQDGSGKRYSGFFFPHNVTPRSSDAWWQGENARLGSLATAARLAAVSTTDPALAKRLRGYATDQLNWILGVNPFDVCMLEGSGRDTTPLYLEYADGAKAGSWRWLRWAGGIVNGITGRSEDGRGIAWDPGEAETGPNTDWRWLEQWLPHSTWFLYAVAVGG